MPRRARGPAAPGVAQGQREGVGGIGGLRELVQPQDARDHRLHLPLVGGAVAGDRPP